MDITGQYNAESNVSLWYQAWHIYKALNSPSTPLTHKIVISPWTQRIWTIFGSILVCDPSLVTKGNFRHVKLSTSRCDCLALDWTRLSLPLILIPATRSVWRFKYFQFRDESGINIRAVLEMELASDHFIQWWSYLLVVIFFPSWRSYCRWSWKLCGDKILHNYASASSWESVHYMTLLPYYTISSHYHPIIASLIINRRITLMSMMWDGEMRMVARKDMNQKTTQKYTEVRL